MTTTSLRGALALIALCLAPALASAQSNDYRQSRTYVGVAIGHHSYYGPTNLWAPRSRTNYTRLGDPAVAGLVSFPLIGERIDGRIKFGLTNFKTSDGEEVLIEGKNDFLINNLGFIEGNIVVPFGSDGRLLPYVFTGLGLLRADPFGKNKDIRDERGPIEDFTLNNWYVPLGAGLDFAVTPRFSVFAETGWNVATNSLFPNKKEPDPFNTLLALVGVRLNFGQRSLKTIIPVDEPICPICPTTTCPECEVCQDCATPPPVIEIVPDPEDCCLCTITDLQSVTFDNNSAIINYEARQRLIDNVVAVTSASNSDCHIEIIGYYGPEEDVDIGIRRAESVRDFYVLNGIDEARLIIGLTRLSSATCGKKSGGSGCAANQVVDSVPMCVGKPRCE